MSWGSVALTEIIWTLCGVASLMFSRKNLAEIKRSQLALLAMNGKNIERLEILRIIAFGHYRNEMFRIGKAALIIMSGVIAMFLPPANPDMPVSPLQLVIVMAVFGIALQIMLASALDARQRELLRRINEARIRPSATRSEDEPPTT